MRFGALQQPGESDKTFAKRSSWVTQVIAAWDYEFAPDAQLGFRLTEPDWRTFGYPSVTEKDAEVIQPLRYYSYARGPFSATWDRPTSDAPAAWTPPPDSPLAGRPLPLLPGVDRPIDWSESLGPVAAAPTVAELVERASAIHWDPASYQAPAISVTGSGGIERVQTLALRPSRVWRALEAGGKAVWHNRKYVLKVGSKFLGPIGVAGNIWDAYSFLQWVNGLPGPIQRPLGTEYQLASNSILFEHPDGTWQDHPPTYSPR